MGAALVLPAASQYKQPGKMTHKSAVGMKMGMSNDMIHNRMMMGFTAAQKAKAMSMMKAMSPSEHMLYMKMMGMCMKHSDSASMMKQPMSDQDKMNHMMMGLTGAEKKTMMGMMAKMNADQKMMTGKMAVNCCMARMKGMKSMMHKKPMPAMKAKP